MQSARARVFDNLDPNVQDKLKSYDAQQGAVLNTFERLLLQVTRHELDPFATFDADGYNFTLAEAPANGIPVGRYFFKSKPQPGAHQYRYGSDLRQYVVQSALTEETPERSLVFSIDQSERVASAVRDLVGEHGTLTAELLTFTTRAGDDTVTESYILAAGRSDSGLMLDAEQIEQILDLSCVRIERTEDIEVSDLQPALVQQAEAFTGEVQNRSAQFSIEQGDLIESRLKDHKAKYDADTRKLEKDRTEALAQAPDRRPHRATEMS